MVGGPGEAAGDTALRAGHGVRVDVVPDDGVDGGGVLGGGQPDYPQTGDADPVEWERHFERSPNFLFYALVYKCDSPSSRPHVHFWGGSCYKTLSRYVDVFMLGADGA